MGQKGSQKEVVKRRKKMDEIGAYCDINLAILGFASRK